MKLFRYDKRHQLYIAHIIEAAEAIESFVEGCNNENFTEDPMRWAAILYKLQTTAESTKRLPTELKNKYPEISWQDIAGFRNILVHDYLDGLNEEVVWRIINVDLAYLKKAMLELCPGWEELKSKRQKLFIEEN